MTRKFDIAVDGFREGAHDCLEDFVSWREGMLTRIQNLLPNYYNVTRVALKRLKFEETLQQVAGNVILFCIASWNFSTTRRHRES